MKVESIKNELVEWLLKLDDKSVLASLLQFKKSTESGDWTDNLTKDQLESLNRGFSDLEKGNVISSEDFLNSYGRKV